MITYKCLVSWQRRSCLRELHLGLKAQFFGLCKELHFSLSQTIGEINFLFIICNFITLSQFFHSTFLSSILLPNHVFSKNNPPRSSASIGHSQWFWGVKNFVNGRCNDFCQCGLINLILVFLCLVAKKVKENLRMLLHFFFPIFRIKKLIFVLIFFNFKCRWVVYIKEIIFI